MCFALQPRAASSIAQWSASSCSATACPYPHVRAPTPPQAGELGPDAAGQRQRQQHSDGGGGAHAGGQHGIHQLCLIRTARRREVISSNSSITREQQTSSSNRRSATEEKVRGDASCPDACLASPCSQSTRRPALRAGITKVSCVGMRPLVHELSARFHHRHSAVDASFCSRVVCTTSSPSCTTSQGLE